MRDWTVASIAGRFSCPGGDVARLERRYFPFHQTELKAAGDGWEVAGYASTFGGDPDSYGDVVAKGAFLDSLARRKTKLLNQHDMTQPIGKQLSLEEDEKGLFGRWSILPTTTGKDAHMLLEHGLIDSLSIGFIPVESDWREDGIRVLKKIDLYEVSLVTIPANENAVITSYKSEQPTDLLCNQAHDALQVAMREVKALHERRSADGRGLNDKQREAADRLDAVAKAWIEMRAGLVVGRDAKANDLDLRALELEMARRKYAGLSLGAD